MVELIGTKGNDTRTVAAGSHDVITGTGFAGLDTVRLLGTVTALNVTLDAAASFEVLDFNGRFLNGTNAANRFDLSGVTTVVNAPAGAHALKGGNDIYIGHAGRDHVSGGAGNDILDGRDGNDRLFGGSGNDTLTGGRGDDLLDGGSGNDTFHVSGDIGAGDVFRGGSGADTLVLGKDAKILKNLILNAEAGIEVVRFDGGYHGPVGTSGKNIVDLTGVTSTSGEGENDIFLAGGDDEYYGYAQRDVASGGDGNDILDGGAGNDTLDGGEGDDLLDGGAGNDIFSIDWKSGEDTFRGGAGLDTLQVEQDAIVSRLILNAAASVERIDFVGFDSINAIFGTDKADEFDLTGVTSVIDNVYAINLDAGNDLYKGHAEKDKVFGGAGNDTLSGGAGGDVMGGGDGRDLLLGGANDDRLYGDAGNDRLYGQTGKDRLSGGAGNDSLSGGSGNDKLYGGAGADRLHGGSGKDLFLFTAATDSTVGFKGRDTILDFDRKEGDRIDLRAIDASTQKKGNQAFDFIGADAFSKTAGELRYKKAGGDTYVLADRNGDGKADFAIRLDDALSLSKGDFLL